MNEVWETLVARALSRWPTPFFLFSWRPIKDALKQLEDLKTRIPIRNWLSMKTQPLAPLLTNWKSLGCGVEVVSEYEFLAACKEGFQPEQILVNGVAKDRWLPANSRRGLRVHFDSLRELLNLQHHPNSSEWSVGVRCHVSEEYDPDEPQFGGQFGMTREEALTGIKKLNQDGAKQESIHFHLRANVRSPRSYEQAMIEVSEICKEADFSPTYVDCGGGLPVEGEVPVGTGSQTASFDMEEFRSVLGKVSDLFPDAREIWLENGRFLTARSGVLVARVVDIKDRKDSRYLICDGGRTNHALVSDWERHEILTIPRREGQPCLTTVCGPTCMAFDRLARIQLASSVEIGDLVIWKNAGAYHIPWETRFSHGLAAVIWHDQNDELSLARDPESFASWWGQWKS